ncbi:peptidase inhibitor family I36 protein [Streptomyces sp. NPDC001514]
MKPARTLLALAAALLFVLTGTLAASAQDRPTAASKESAWMEGQIAGLLRHNEGAKRVGTDRVELEPGVTMTVLPAGPAAATGVNDCRTYYACVWQHRDAGGYRLDFYYCRFYELGNYSMPDGTNWHDQVSSYYNAQTDGAWVVGYNWDPEYRTWDWIWGGPPGRYEAQVAYDNWADGVKLEC